MTVTYTASVATSYFGTFIKLLARWRGSIYKLMWRELFVFILAFYTISFIYRFALTDPMKRKFDKFALYCEGYNNLIPVAFVLGFYVSIIITRWWDQFNSIPWPDRMAVFVTANVHGHDVRGRLMRRSIMRYACLSYVFTFASISAVVKKRFPTNDHITEAGFMSKEEQKVIESIETPYNKWFIPLVWSTSLISRARKEGRIKDDFGVKTLLDELNQYRGQLGTLFNYDWISVPLVYTQTVTLSVYTFFLSCLLGRQFLDPKQGYDAYRVDIYVPFFTILQFIFYMGWLKVAESLINPFGEDDEDFDINALIDRNLQVSYLIVDGMHLEHPQLIKDQYWDDTDFELPYTAAAEPFKTNAHVGSAVDISVSHKDAEFVHMQSVPENELLTSYMEHGTTLVGDQASPTSIPRPFGHTGLFHRENSKKLGRYLPGRQTSAMSTSTFQSDAKDSQQHQNGSIWKLSEDGQDIFAMSDLEDHDGTSHRSRLNVVSPSIMERVEMIDVSKLPKISCTLASASDHTIRGSSGLSYGEQVSPRSEQCEDSKQDNKSVDEVTENTDLLQ